ncbi:MAG: amino acid adenylation domain-containing protein, partial [Verrucomicrobia bacterium]|nr:amino acid adenylation domain-containing protein [Verrucomicrobiota bacterium]
GLIADGLVPGEVVGIAVASPPALAVALLGVLKAGGIAVFLDLKSPPARLADIVTEAGVHRLVGDESTPAGVAARPLHTLDLRHVAGHPEGNPGLPIPPGALMALYYTSGTTGRPRGICRSHRQGLYEAWLYGSSMEVTPEDRLLMPVSFTFGASTRYVLGAWLSGATLCPVLPEDLGATGILRFARDIRATHFYATPSLFRHCCAALDAAPPLESLRAVTLTGEAARRGDVEGFLRVMGGRPGRLLNSLGSTECGAYCHLVVTPEMRLSGDILPNGHPVPGKEVLIVDAQRRPVPDGESGEIAVRSRYLTPGYWRRPDLDADRLVVDAADPELRTFHTGDLGRREPDGGIRVLGRQDQQLKVRGYRVEAGEIEAALDAHPAVRGAVVLAADPAAASAALVAHLLLHPDVAVPDAAALNRHLLARLPSYMVPSQYRVLEDFPLTERNKTDRRAVARMPWRALTDRSSAAAAGTPATVRDSALEKELHALWSSVLAAPDADPDPHRNFFASGGTSLQAQALLAGVQRRFGAAHRLTEFLAEPTVAGLARLVAQASAGPADGPTPAAGSGDPPPTPATDEQIHLWISHEIAADPAAYHVPCATRLKGPVDWGRLASAWDILVRRHDILRTRMRLEGGELLLEVVPATGAAMTMGIQDLRGIAPESREAAVQARLREAACEPLDPLQAPLWRCRLFLLSDGEGVLSFTAHHLIVDERSLHVLFADLALAYRAAAGEPVVLPPLPIRFTDFAAWKHRQRRERLAEPAAAAADAAFWRTQLEGAGGSLARLADRLPRGASTGRGDRVTARVEPQVRERLEGLARQEGATPFLVAFAAWQSWLCHRGGLAEIVVGTPVAERERTEMEPLVGLFLQTLPIRTRVPSGSPFRPLVREVQAAVSAGIAHAASPLAAHLGDAVRQEGRQRVFPSLFAMVDRAWTTLQLPEATGESVPVHTGTAKHELTLLMGPEPGGGWWAELEFDTDRFTPERGRQLLSEFVAFLDQAGRHPDAAPPSPWQSPAHHPAVRAVASVPGRFRDQAARHPDAEALVGGNRRWSYRELDAATDRLARRLRLAGVAAGDRVGLHRERSARWVVSALAILKAGAAYVPLLPDWPGPRLRALAEGAGIRMLLGPEAPTGTPGWLPAGVSCLGDDPGDPVSPDLVPDVGCPDPDPESPAYVLFTSGSTGQPKGVRVPHRAIHRLVVGQDYVPFQAGMRSLHHSSPAFDASTFEVWAPLLHGGACVVVEEPRVDVDLLELVLRRERISVLWLTAGFFNSVVDLRPEILRGVADVLVGGEALSIPHVRRALASAPDTRFTNGYGPTETTTFAVTGRILSVPDSATSIPIGVELAGTHGAVLDESGMPVAPGEPGELYLGGDGVALGYLNDADLTAARFLPDPSDPDGSGRRYRTGDRVRRLPDGRLEFLGRLDHQVKIRGHRVEPAEIEAALMGHPAIRRAVVIPRSVNGLGELVACIQRHPGASTDAAALRAFLAGNLPPYLCPDRYLEVDTIPLTATGKVDRAALAAAGGTALEDITVRAAGPGTPLETLLCREWAAVLGRPSVGIHDSFFDLGGHSLLALRLVSRLQGALQRPVRLADLFTRPTVAQFAALLEPPAAAAEAAPRRFRGAPVGVPWFHVPGLFGLECLTPALAAVIGRHRPYFDGLQFPGLDHSGEPRSEVASIASALADQVMLLHPEGPLWLSGYSFGGIVAHEMARQLTARGHPVECVVLFDTCVSGAIRRRPWPEAIRALHRSTRRQLPGRRLAFLGGIVQKKVRDAMRVLASRFRRRAPNPEERVEAASRAAYRAHRPEAYTGRVFLLRGDQPMSRETGLWTKEPNNGWDFSRHGRFEVVRLDCSHESIFLEPVAPQVLEAVEALLTSQTPRP